MPDNITHDDKDERCAPSKTFEDGSCIPLYLLVEMANAYNEENSDNKIQLSSKLETLNPSKYKTHLLQEFSHRLNKVCGTQKCWVKQRFITKMNNRMKEELEKNTFRPKGPQGKFTWLNTFNIEDGMNQYETLYPEFKFLGAVPIDFDDLPDLGLKDLDFDELTKKDKKTKIGIIFNLDEHDKDGSHWVSLYADFSKGTVYFSDSYGIEPDPRIRKIMRRMAKYMESNGKHVVAEHNKIRAQYGGSECGVYSMAFITRQLKGDSFKEICEEKVSDKEINACRQKFFS